MKRVGGQMGNPMAHWCILSVFPPLESPQSASRVRQWQVIRTNTSARQSDTPNSEAGDSANLAPVPTVMVRCIVRTATAMVVAYRFTARREIPRITLAGSANKSMIVRIRSGVIL